MNAPADHPLSPEQREAFAEGVHAAQRILKACRVAAIQGWTLGVLGVPTLLIGLVAPPSFLVGIGMLVLARNELRGRALLRRFDPAGAVLLSRNQLGLMGLIVLYCAWRVHHVWTQPSAALQELEGLLDTGGTLEPLVRQITTVFYGVVVILSVIVQSVVARYYRLREGLVRSYVADTPAWVVDLQRLAAGAGPPE